MSSVRCPECNLLNWATTINCKRCGYFLNPPFDDAAAQQSQTAENSFGGQHFAADSTSMPPAESPTNFHAAHQNPPNDWSNSHQNGQSNRQTNYRQDNSQANYRQPNQPNYQPSPLKSGMAIASMVLGILGFVTSIILIGIPLALTGLILGIVALVRANKKPNTYGGKGFAIAGIATGALATLFFPIIAAIAIPNLLAARRAANEGSAISTVRTLSAAEQTYRATAGSGRCGDLKQLQAMQLIDPSLGASNQKSGYRFMVTNLPLIDGGCEIHTTPVSASTGTRSFYFSTEDGLIRAASKNGQFASQSDAPLGQNSSSLDRRGRNFDDN